MPTSLFNASLPVSSSVLLATLLLSVRLAPVMVMTPAFGGLGLPSSVRVLLVVALSFVLALGVPSAQLAGVVDVSALWSAALSELVIGALLAFGVLCAFGAFAFAGRLLDLQAGFGVSQLFDPVMRSQVPVLSSAFAQLALVLFFAFDAHHVVMRAASLSLERFPPGAALDVSVAAPVVFAQLALVFSLGFSLVAPVVFWLLLTEFGLAVLSRVAPQMNVLLLGMPVRLVAAVLGLGLWLKLSARAMGRVYETIFEAWGAWLN